MIIPLNLKRGRTKERLKVDSPTLWVESEDMKENGGFSTAPCIRGFGKEGEEGNSGTTAPPPHVPLHYEATLREIERATSVLVSPRVRPTLSCTLEPESG